MVGSKEAERMTYLEYKLAVWSRLVGFWTQYRADHPELTKAAERLQTCEAQLRHWQRLAA